MLSVAENAFTEPLTLLRVECFRYCLQLQENERPHSIFFNIFIIFFFIGEGLNKKLVGKAMMCLEIVNDLSEAFKRL